MMISLNKAEKDSNKIPLKKYPRSFACDHDRVPGGKDECPPPHPQPEGGEGSKKLH